MASSWLRKTVVSPPGPHAQLEHAQGFLQGRDEVPPDGHHLATDFIEEPITETTWENFSRSQRGTFTTQ